MSSPCKMHKICRLSRTRSSAFLSLLMDKSEIMKKSLNRLLRAVKIFVYLHSESVQAVTEIFAKALLMLAEAHAA